MYKQSIFMCYECVTERSVIAVIVVSQRVEGIMVEVTGFEPAASASRTQRSTKLSHTSIFSLEYEGV